jgi:hypothetical protein
MSCFLAEPWAGRQDLDHSQGARHSITERLNRQVQHGRRDCIVGLGNPIQGGGQWREGVPPIPAKAPSLVWFPYWRSKKDLFVLTG